jgi:hypothetical protein
MTAERDLEHEDVELRLELPELPGGPEAEISPSDDDDVGRGVAGKGWPWRDLAGLVEPPSSARVQHHEGAAPRRLRAMLQATLMRAVA